MSLWRLVRLGMAGLQQEAHPMTDPCICNEWCWLHEALYGEDDE
jgi:hypothetical protein